VNNHTVRQSRQTAVLPTRALLAHIYHEVNVQHYECVHVKGAPKSCVEWAKMAVQTNAGAGLRMMLDYASDILKATYR
jgi:hypothetical protein